MHRRRRARLAPAVSYLGLGTFGFLVVAGEREAAVAARRYLAYFQGVLSSWDAPNQRLLRHAVPENRGRGYDVRTVMRGLADTGAIIRAPRKINIRARA